MVPNPAADPERPCILVVEDEPLVRAVITDGLREAGFRVLEAASAEGALSYFSVGLQVDAVFTDVRLSGALNGLDLARRLRAERPELPVVLTSGNHTHGSEWNVTLFFPKPYNIAEVAALLATLLAAKDGGER